MTRPSSRSARPLLWLFLLTLLTQSGCIPAVAWLPDSSGFVYTTGGKDSWLILFDVAAGKGRDLAKISNPWLVRPAVSPDGKRIAVATISSKNSLQITIYNLEGKELLRSEELAMDSKDVQDPRYQVFWPQQDKLLISTDRGMIQSILYDLKTQRLRTLGSRPAIFGATCVLPSGKGYLANTESGAYVLVDWDGQESTFEDPETLLHPKAPGLLFPYVYSSAWEGDLAKVSWSGERLTIDTAKRTVTAAAFKPARNEDGNIVQHVHQFPKGGAAVRFVELEARKPREVAYGVYRIEVLKPGEKKPHALVSSARYFTLSPSPDGRFLAIFCKNDPRKESKPVMGMGFVVLDSTGRVVTEIDLQHKSPEPVLPRMPNRMVESSTKSYASSFGFTVGGWRK